MPGKEIRFIPARAGNTLAITDLRLPCTVYPRSRGEHGDLLADTVNKDGLSPLARGTL